MLKPPTWPRDMPDPERKRKAHLVSLYDWRCHAAPVQFGGGRARIKMERPSRLRAAIEVIEEVQREPGKRGRHRIESLGGATGADSASKRWVPAISTDEEESALAVVKTCHSSRYVASVRARALAAREDETLKLSEESDTLVSRASWVSALAAVSVSMRAVDEVARGGARQRSFAAVRPPGHHAGYSGETSEVSGNGFCLFNNVACAAKYAVAAHGFSHVAVLDFDVHHGNGTEDILCPPGIGVGDMLDDSAHAQEPVQGEGKMAGGRFLYISLHAHDEENVFPSTGAARDSPGSLNLPMRRKFRAAEAMRMLDTHIAPKLGAFFSGKPGSARGDGGEAARPLLIISAGFDAHRGDPTRLGDLSAEDFGGITARVLELADELCEGQVVSILEGGYGADCDEEGFGRFKIERRRSPAPASGPKPDFKGCLEAHLRALTS